jgi:glycosidase
MFKNFLPLLLPLLFLLSCQDDDAPAITDPDPPNPEGPAPFDGVPAVEDMVFYEINLRAFSAAGNFQGVEDRLDSIKALGVNVIWLMPIHPIGQVNSVGELGSPYSVKNYQEVSPEYGSLDDLKRLVAQAHGRGMAVVLDWVANHTAWDHPWISAHPEWYTRDGNGNILIPAGTNWQDVADLNFSNADMRLEMIKSMQYWILNANVDGFRCDAADLVPFSFWQQAIDSLENMPGRNLILLAEGARADHFAAGFQLNFGWDFYNTSKNVFRNNASATNYWTTNTTEYNSVPAGAEKLRFTTNHDESAWDASPIALFGGQKGAMSAFVITAYLDGVPLIYAGQEVGRANTTPFFSKSPINWTANPAYLAEYKQVMAFRQSSDAIRKGQTEAFPNGDVVVFKKKLGTEEVLVVANPRNAVITYTLPSALANTDWKDALTQADVSLGTQVVLGAYAYLILE